MNSNAIPQAINTFQGLILALQNYWAQQGCVVLQPYDMEMGAGTFHTATFLRALGPETWNAAYVQPSRRPADGRYGENPNRLQHYYQFQVVLKPNPDNIQELYLNSLLAIALSLSLMMLYVMLRFRWKFSVGAVSSLLHDTLFTVGVFSIMGWPFDLAVLAAVLALIGYSLNDTIVVFDRIRENFRRLRKADPVEIVDISLTETLRRTIMTVATVVLVVVALLFLGGPALKWFSVAMLVGLFAGTYSSIYIATAYALAMGLSKEDFVITKPKEEFVEEGDIQP